MVEQIYDRKMTWAKNNDDKMKNDDNKNEINKMDGWEEWVMRWDDEDK